MILKLYNLNKNLDHKINYYLLYGKNTGQIEELINDILKPKFSKNIHTYDEQEILTNSDNFKENIYNSSFFENDKLIIVNRASDKFLSIVEELLEKDPEDLKLIIKAGILEKKSKLRNFFEKSKQAAVIAFYEDDQNTLIKIAQNFFNQKKIKVTQEIINHIIKKAVGDRGALKNELEKIENFSQKKTNINLEEIIKITNLAENYKISELTDNCLAKRKRQTINILNENISSTEDNILILKSFLFKLKRLKKLQEQIKLDKNYEKVLSSYKPPIFWKDKEIIKEQLKALSISEVKIFIKRINELECLVKKNNQISDQIINNFILERLESPNNLI